MRPTKWICDAVKDVSARNRENASVAAARSRPTSDLTNSPNPSDSWRARADVVLIAGFTVDEHLLERGQVRRGELSVASQLLQGDVVLVVAEVGAGLRAKPFVVRADVHPAQLDRAELAL